MPVIFVQTHHNYGSYIDFWKLVELSGYPVVYEDEMELDNPEHCYIITWFVAQPDRFGGAKARVICWNLEWANNPILPGVEYWSPDAWYAAYNNWKYVPVGSDKRLFCDDDQTYPKIYDIALMMYRDPNRRRVEIQRISEAGLTVAPNGWGEERHRALMQSKCLVHIHQLEGINTVSSLRFALAAAYSLPIVTEELFISGIYKNWIFEAKYGSIADAVKNWLEPVRQGDFIMRGENLHYVLCEHYAFKHVVESNV